MGKSCLDGYLTPECATCPDWSDGVDGKPIGCNTSMPIMWCKAFAKMFNEREPTTTEESEA